MPYPQILFDILHLFPTLLVSIIIMAILYFALRNYKRRKLLALAVGFLIGFIFYLNGDSYLNAKRFYKKHKDELEKIVLLYQQTSAKVAYNIWIGGDNDVNIGLSPDSTEPYKMFNYYPESSFDSVCKKELLRRGEISERELDILVNSLLSIGCKELSKSPHGITDVKYPNEPYVIGITYKHFPVGFSYFYGFSFLQNGYKLPSRERYKVDSNVYFYRTRTSINGY
ncbi:hypothetical protein [Pinibacter soli]|uniref:Uncharacterized protein n=1 Tax=Pinibacter soli TaxID=3044211 RepID=A0ABT6R6N5_9BACT|nr:hypothetical protein [Pinibacter soli]MDI3318222.1 hypothetical protein [Pinibacter soli]